jgi:hypothetical protein
MTSSAGRTSTMQEAKLPRRWFIKKHLCGMCGVGKFLVQWKEAQVDQCPRCGAPEDARHVWEFRASSTIEKWHLLLQLLAMKLSKMSTDPSIQRAILIGLQEWLQPRETSIKTSREIFLKFRRGTRLLDIARGNRLGLIS